MDKDLESLDMRARNDVAEAVVYVLSSKLPPGYHSVDVIRANLKDASEADVRHHILDKALAQLETNGVITRGEPLSSDVLVLGGTGPAPTFGLKTRTAETSNAGGQPNGTNCVECSKQGELRDDEPAVVRALDELGSGWHPTSEVVAALPDVRDVPIILFVLAYNKCWIHGDLQGTSYCSCNYPRPPENS
jgi:hypothetical protein